MEAYVNGKVVHDEGSYLIVKCLSGRLVNVNCDDIFNRPKIIGREVEIKGGAYFNNGEIAVYAKEVAVLRKKRPYAKIYKQGEN